MPSYRADEHFSHWSYSNAQDINEFGDIVATFRRDDGTRGVYVYNFGFLDESLETPTPIDLGIDTSANTHRINSPIPGVRGAQVVGTIFDSGNNATGFRITLGLQQNANDIDYFPPVVDPSTGNVLELFAVHDINDVGDFGGAATNHFPRKIQGRDYENLGWLKTDSLETFTFHAGRGPYRLNESRDFVTVSRELFHGNWGFLSPVALLDPADPESATWQGTSNYELLGIGDRDGVTDFPQLFGIAQFDDPSSPFFSYYKGFVLTPVLP